MMNRFLLGLGSTMIVALMALTGCAGLKTRHSADGSLEAPPPEDSPAVVAQSQPDMSHPNFPVVDIGKWNALDTGKTGVIFAWTLSGSPRLVSESGCRLRVRHRESGDTVLLKLDGKTPVSIQQLKPGTWDAKRLGCGLTRIWDLEDLFRDGFVVKAGSISVIGWFLFEFDQRTLVTVREGGRQENTKLAAQLRSAWPAMGSTLISGFSGKALPAKIEVRDEIVRVKSTNLDKSDERLQPLLTRFQSCASQAMKVDPLRAGHLKMDVAYKAGQFSAVRSTSGDHALRDDFVQCLLQAHEGFVVTNGGDFSLETHY